MPVRLRFWLFLVALLTAASACLAATPGGDDVGAGRIRALLESRRYAELTELLEGLQAACDRDIEYEYAAYNGFQAFAVRAPSYGALLDNWVRNAPGNWVPLTARAAHEATAARDERAGRRRASPAGVQPGMAESGVAAALRALEASLRIRPRQLYAFALLMEICQDAGDREKGALLAGRALAHYPHSYLLRRRHMLSLAPRSGGSYDAMTNFARQTAPYARKNPRLKILAGLIPFDQAETAASRGDYATAVALYEQALAHGTTWDVLYGLADCQYRAKRYDEAHEALDRAMALSPGAAEGFGLRSKIFFAQRNLDEAAAAVEKMERAAGFGPGEASAIRTWESRRLVSEGHGLFRNGDLSAAIERYTSAIRFYPNNADAYCWRGIANDRVRDPDAALADLRQAIALSPRLFAAYKGLDDLLYRQGRVDEIIASWTRLIQLEPGNDNAYVERSGAYSRKRDKAAAIRDLERACGMRNDQACYLLKSLPGRDGR